MNQQALAVPTPPACEATKEGPARKLAPELTSEQLRGLAIANLEQVRLCRRMASEALNKADFYLDEAERLFDLASGAER